MPFVELLATQADGTQKAIARFTLGADGRARFEPLSAEATPEFWEKLRKGVPGPDAGLAFLESLRARFDGAYLRATAVKA